MASVFLANAPYSLEDRYGKLAQVGATLPNLGLLMLGAILRRAGHRVRILDAPAQGIGYRKALDNVKAFHPDVVGLTAVTPSVMKAAKFAGMIKELDQSVPVLVGGPHVTALPDKTLKDYSVFDCAVIGEGEETILDVVDTLSQGEHPSKVPGTAVRINGHIKINPLREPIMNLDTLPLPAWDLLDGFPKSYRPALFKFKRLPSMHIVTSRGCPDRCIFCDTSVFSHKVRFHSSDYVLETIEQLVKDYNVKEIIFEDDQFLLKKQRVVKICEGILKAKWNIAWSCSGRVNRIDDPSLLRLMKRSGCWQINFGIESADQRILNFARKEITVGQIERAIHLTHQAGLLSKGYFILGLPNETEKTMEKTIRFTKKLPLTDISVFMLTPYPGTEMYVLAEQYGTLERDFEKWNLLDVVFVPEGLTREKLLFYQKRFMKKFYLRPHKLGNYLQRVLVNPSNLFNLLRGFYGFLGSVSDRGPRV
ncbi:B12-binding domain-containing radical SAM protein [Thermodesulfobacteriota bacterium]